MNYRINQKNGDKLSILGFGCMRLPAKAGIIDEKRAIKMIRDSIKKGVNYFDTAYIYHGGQSESLLGKALRDGYRQKVKIATKLPPYMVKKLDNAKKIMLTQLEKLNTDCIDYYLLHMLTDKAMFDKMADLGVMEWLEDLKGQETIKNIGFSFHGSRQDFELIVKAYPWDFCQIQYNYLDENNQAGLSGLKLAHSLGIPVIVMEPLRGGKLVNNLPKEVLKIFERVHPQWTPAEWGLRWIWNHKEVNVVLSGMSTEDQVNDNIETASQAVSDSLTNQEIEVFDLVKSIINERIKVPCTACGYCMPCPHGVNIPGCFAAYNDKFLLDEKMYRWKYAQALGALSAEPAFASKCVECGRCELHCPQNIEIRKELKAVAKTMEGVFFRPVVGAARKILKIR
ncbi:MAG TPA: aldo/keto reductase [Sedimentibacter sp.]|nr:aldo/keto reductase [Sedimentibacter sp.]HOV27197.1 aldo/keto reductase [Pseudobacteroides sp.]HRC81447.1 aldo/keto reductase [Sedimentibacter sp.]